MLGEPHDQGKDGVTSQALDKRTRISDAIVAASRSGGSLTQRFSSANGQTIQNLPGASRGFAVRAIHSALLGAGAK
jgi:hypothetical protein